jgi:DNA mismatch repair protein MSH2
MVRPQMLEPADSVKLAGGDVDVLDLRAVRHPLVEQRQGGRFVGNDVVLGGRDGGALWIVTGPNMGGKSTLMRSVGIALVLAHAGCFVPADKATLTIRDSIQCRVGAVDYLSSGLSTFMVEMLESSAILHNATPQSFVMIDELGRGTSTFDGFGIAWAIAEELAARKRCQALFASHFHELCELEGKHPDAVRNVHVTAEQVEPTTAGGTPGLKFLYRLANGPSRRSFGVHVAKLAGMPAAVVEEARSKAAELESSVAQPSPTSGVASDVKTEGAAEFDAPSLASCLLAEERSALLKAVAAVAAPGDATLTETGALAGFAAALRGVVQRLDPDTVATA